MTTDTMAATRSVPAAGAKATDLPKRGPSLVVQTKAPRTLDEVRANLQLAVELEHATLPAYLQAAYSLDDAKNGVIAGMIVDAN